MPKSVETSSNNQGAENQEQFTFDFSAKNLPLAIPLPLVYRVTDIVKNANQLLQERFDNILVEGEIDSFKLHTATGHLYFALKDSGACLNAFMPRMKAQKLSFTPKDGLKVQVRGHLSIYEQQGRFHISVSEMTLSGDGALQAQLEELKRKLSAEGLFSQSRKRMLPKFPQRIGLATSLSGAALQDILNVAFRRGKAHILIAPCAVQGEAAPTQICAALSMLQDKVDVIIVGRGGGSATDLWAFNDENVVRAIANSKVPIVSAVGHEVDFTLADSAADCRAPTPSAAAELVMPEFLKLEQELHHWHMRLLRVVQREVETAQQKLDNEITKAESLLQKHFSNRQRALAEVNQKLTLYHPRVQLTRNSGALQSLKEQLFQKQKDFIMVKKQALAGLAGQLDAMSPLAVLSRGYSVVKNAKGEILRQASHAKIGESVDVRLGNGEISCVIEKVTP